MRTTFLVLGLILVGLTLLRTALVSATQAAGIVWVSDDNPTRRGQMEGFTKKTGKPIRIDPTNGTVEKVIVQSLGGVGPDVFDCYDASQLSAYVRAGVAKDLTDELAAHGIDLKSQVFKGCLGQAEFQGRIYGVPTNIAADGIWFHQELMPAGLLPARIESWDQLAQIAQQLTKRDANGRVQRYGLLFEWWNWKHFVVSCGGQIFDETGERCLIDQPNAIRGIQVMHDLVYKYKVAPTPTEEASMTTQGGWGSGAISYFGARRGALALGGRWWMASLNQYKGLNLGVLEGPTENGGNPRAYGRATLVNPDSPRYQEALEFLLFLASRDYNEIVDAQSDGTPAFREYASHEGSNKTWTAIATKALPDKGSPYIDGSNVDRIINKQLDLVKANERSPAEAMRTAAAQINAIIAKNRRPR